MSIRARLRRLEQKVTRVSVPTRSEFDDAAQRECVRNLQSAYGKLDPDLPRQRFKESDLKLIEGDTPERIEADRRTVERYERANGMGDETASYAERARQKLKSMTRVLDR